MKPANLWFIVPAVFFLLVACFGDVDSDDGFYDLLRIGITGLSAYMAVYSYQKGITHLVWILGGIAVIFNPVLKIHMDRDAWKIIDFLAAGGIGYGWWFFEKKEIFKLFRVFQKKTNTRNTIDHKYLGMVPSEIAEAIYELDAGEIKCPSSEFKIIRKVISDSLLEDHSLLLDALSDNPTRSSKEWVWAQIANISAEMVESGRCHIYRGVLSEKGTTYLSIYNYSLDVLLELKAHTQDWVNEQKRLIIINLKNVG